MRAAKSCGLGLRKTRLEVRRRSTNPVGASRLLQPARGNAVEKLMKLRAAWAGIWQANTLGQALVWPEDDGPVFHRPPTDVKRKVLSSYRVVIDQG